MARKAHMEGGGECVPNLAPLVDVIMVLLIFFLLGTSLDVIKEGVLETELDASSGPGSGASVELIESVEIGLSDVNEGEDCTIMVKAGGRTDTVGSFADLMDYMNQKRRMGADTNNPVIISAATTVRWKYVVHAMDTAVRAKFTNVQFAVSFEQ